MLLAVACGVIPTAPLVRPPDRADEAGQLLARLAAEETGLTTVRGLATVLYSGPNGSGSVLQAIVLAPPDRARLETLSPVGTTALVLTIRGDDLRVHSPLRNEYGEGRATQETLARLTRVPLPPEPLLRLLAGLPPLPLHPGDPRVQVRADGGALRLDSVEGAFWQRLWTQPDRASIDHGELGEAAGPLLRFQFADRQGVNGTSFPFEIRLVATAGPSLIIRYQTLRINLPVEADLFALPRPTDERTRILDLGGSPLP